MPTPINLADLGRRVRSMRVSRGLTLEEVVERAEFTVSWLSKLENGLLSPSLEGLVKLSEVLECGVEELVEGLSVRPKHVLVRKGGGRLDSARDRNSELRYEHLADAWRGRGMNPVILYLGGSGGNGSAVSHDGERFLLVLEGEIKIEYGSEWLHLKEGDSVYIDATIPHSLAAPGRSKAKVLSVSFEPSRQASRNGAAASRRGSSGRRLAPATQVLADQPSANGTVRRTRSRG